jgi:hypothetical protein
MYKLPEESTATAMGSLSFALVAAPPSPVYAASPAVPAYVEMMPAGLTRRMT